MSDDLKWQRRNKLLSDHRKEEEEKAKEEQKKNSTLDDINMERELFDAVRSYIRDNDVNEFMVAKEFGIPVSKVKEWIRQGRIEYKEGAGSTVFVGGGTCYNCGRRIDFGSLCTKCKRAVEGKQLQGFAVQMPDTENGKMRSNLRNKHD